MHKSAPIQPILLLLRIQSPEPVRPEPHRSGAEEDVVPIPDLVPIRDPARGASARDDLERVDVNMERVRVRRETPFVHFLQRHVHQSPAVHVLPAIKFAPHHLDP